MTRNEIEKKKKIESTSFKQIDGEMCQTTWKKGVIYGSDCLRNSRVDNR
ncbi:hypothetical protein SpAB1_17440 [Streptococcus pyogenes]|nr:hypothetical protein SpAB1_17440 [Streptococcus pyogenes]